MSVPAAYLAVVLIWSTTPLAIKWSGEGGGFLFGVTGRIVTSAFVALAAMILLREPLYWHRRARRAYLIAGCSVYASMLSIYWAAQFIPSGWISVLFGLSPIMTGVMAALWLGESRPGIGRIGGMALALGGLGVIFGTGFAAGSRVSWGIAAAVVAVLFHSASAVWLKRLGGNLSGIAVTTGGLLVSSLLFLLTWFLSGAVWPEELPARTGYAILYLALFGSVIGWTLFYYVLKNVDVVRVALITVVTPVTALFLGHVLNGEALGWRVWLGTGLIVLGLLCHEFAGRIPMGKVAVHVRSASAGG